MPTRIGVTAVVAVATAVLGAILGVPGHLEASVPVTDEEQHMELRDQQPAAIAATRQGFEALDTAIGYEVFSAFFDYEDCSAPNTVQGMASGRLRRVDDLPATRSQVETARDVLGGVGWEPIVSDTIDDGIRGSQDAGFNLLMTRDGFTLRMAFRRADGESLFAVRGPCVEVDGDETFGYRMFAPIDLGLIVAAVDDSSATGTSSPVRLEYPSDLLRLHQVEVTSALIDTYAALPGDHSDNRATVGYEACSTDDTETVNSRPVVGGFRVVAHGYVDGAASAAQLGDAGWTAVEPTSGAAATQAFERADLSLDVSPTAPQLTLAGSCVAVADDDVSSATHFAPLDVSFLMASRIS